MTLETKDKNFNSVMKYFMWFVGGVITVVTMTIAVTKYVKAEVNETVKTSIQVAMAELIYEMKDLKDVKLSVVAHEKALSILTYRVGAMEDRQVRPHISKEFEKPEETEPVTVRREKKGDS